MPSRFTRASFGAALAMILAGHATAGTTAVASAPSQNPGGQVVAETAASPANHEPAGSDPAPSRNAARSRMRECGHQWSAMKKNGSASGMTWKDFSQGCLARQ